MKMFVVNSYGSRESSLAVNSRLLVRQKINTACKAVAAAKTWSWHWQLTTPGRWYRVDRWRPGTSYTGKQQSARYLTAQTVSYRSISWMHLIVRWKFQNLTSLNLTRKPCCRKETARCRKCSFPLKFANNIHYKYKTSQASKAATLRSYKHAGAKRNLTQNQDSKSIKFTCLESVEKQWGNK